VNIPAQSALVSQDTEVIAYFHDLTAVAVVVIDRNRDPGLVIVIGDPDSLANQLSKVLLIIHVVALVGFDCGYRARTW